MHPAPACPGVPHTPASLAPLLTHSPPLFGSRCVQCGKPGHWRVAGAGSDWQPAGDWQHQPVSRPCRPANASLQWGTCACTEKKTRSCAAAAGRLSARSVATALLAEELDIVRHELRVGAGQTRITAHHKCAAACRLPGLLCCLMQHFFPYLLQGLLIAQDEAAGIRRRGVRKAWPAHDGSVHDTGLGCMHHLYSNSSKGN